MHALLAVPRTEPKCRTGLISYGLQKQKKILRKRFYTSISWNLPAVVILQLAAVITCIDEPKLHPQIQQVFPQGIPELAKLLIRTDNSPSQNWAHKVSSKSERGQLLVSIYANMLDRTTFAIHSNHISGVPNTIADFISRPPTHLPSRHLRSEQIFQMAPPLATYRFFRPTSPGFLSILDSPNTGRKAPLSQSRSDDSKPPIALLPLLLHSKTDR